MKRSTRSSTRLSDAWPTNGPWSFWKILGEHGELRLSRLGEFVGTISQKMLSETVRQRERDGLVTCSIHPVIPSGVEYKLTPVGLGLGEACCGVWLWAEAHHQEVERSRQRFDKRKRSAA